MDEMPRRYEALRPNLQFDQIIGGLLWLKGGQTARAAILGNGLQGDMPVSEQSQVRPDFIGDHIDIIGPKNLHHLFQLPAFPHPPGGIVGGAENSAVWIWFSLIFRSISS